MRNRNNDIGMIPNMYADMANNLALLDAYVHSKIRLENIQDLHLKNR